MKRLACFSAALLLAACTATEQAANDQAPLQTDAPVAPASPLTNSAPEAPARTAENVVSEAPFTPDSAQGAAQVVQTYYALLEARKYVEAHKLWGPGSDLADATFADQFTRYREYHAEIGAPGEIEGAAGSLYVEVPVRTYGVTTAGERFEVPGAVTLRRVNNVDGSTPEQRRWHIAKIDLPPH
jgi:hypothetical protein